MQRQEYQLLTILSQQLSAHYPEHLSKNKKENWWNKTPETKEIVTKMHEIIANFKYEPPKEDKPIDTNRPRRINFQVR